MATTVGSFSAIDDNEVDADSPVTETLVTRLRDNAYWIDPTSTRTTETGTTLVLKPDGSGSTLWGPVELDGTDGTVASLTTTYVTLTTKTTGTMIFNFHHGDTYHSVASVKVNLSDDTYVSSYSYERSGSSGGGASSGTITTGSTVALATNSSGASATLLMRRDSGNFQLASGVANILSGDMGADWIVL